SLTVSFRFALWLALVFLTRRASLLLLHVSLSPSLSGLVKAGSSRPRVPGRPKRASAVIRHLRTRTKDLGVIAVPVSVRDARSGRGRRGSEQRR
ncbi:Protein of unknown function, partial [Gryllus bimaculatus]